MDKARSDCSCAHHHLAPFALALIGLVLALFALRIVPGDVAAVAWPALLVGAAGAKLGGRLCRCCGEARYAPARAGTSTAEV